MKSFIEANTVEQMILATTTRLGCTAENWEYVPDSNLSKGYQ